jgi:16S rRNA (uracil1498-N3)-methyltransferase
MNSKSHHFPRLFIPYSLKDGHSIIISENQSHYLKNVLRRNDGDCVRLFNPDDGEWIGKIIQMGKKQITLEIETQIRPPYDDQIEIHLFFSPIKKDRNDILIEKAVELGITHFHPVLFGRSIAREIKHDRLSAQMIEAAEQCERLSIPILAPLKDFKKALADWNAEIPLYAAIERTEALHLSKLSLKTKKVALCIGPEGGITEDEATTLGTKKFVTPVSLGQNILRAETAVFFGVSILSSLLSAE